MSADDGNGDDNGESHDTREAMTLRDFFAAHALTGLFSIEAVALETNTGTKNRIAQEAYQMADAMLSERTK